MEIHRFNIDLDTIYFLDSSDNMNITLLFLGSLIWNIKQWKLYGKKILKDSGEYYL